MVTQKLQKTIYTVSQINSIVKVALEEKLPSQLIVKGELSDFKRHSSGHCYFSLKDENSILPAVMWSSKFRSLKFAPKDGMAVLATGHIDVYEAGGKYQLYVDKLDPAGIGALQLAFEQMVAKLQQEGLFSDAHKKPLPAYPMRIGILTSESGAAIHDITDSIHNRWPCAKLFLYPVPVQGEGAAAKIADALRVVNRRNSKLKLDVLIVGRGGGSLEDLWAFNEEVLARAIFESKIPIISAVGHEVDTTIADLVADKRASTPTKAGIAAVPDMQEILAQLINIERRLTGQTISRVTIAKRDLQIILARSVIREPLLLVQNAGQRLDETADELMDVIKEMITAAHNKLSAMYEQVIRIEPHRLLGRNRDRLNEYEKRINNRISSIVNDCRIKLTAQDNRLAGLNPKSVLHRGYSITRSQKTGLVLKTADEIQLEDLLITEFANENYIESKVTKK